MNKTENKMKEIKNEWKDKRKSKVCGTNLGNKLKNQR